MATSKKRGIKSSAQDNFLQPDNVTSLTATDVGTNRPYLATANTTSAASAAGTGGSVTLSWTLPATSPAATSYIITSTPSTYTVDTGSSSTSYTFQGLASATSYTFTVVAKNASGQSSGTTSSSVTVTTVPRAPQNPSVATNGANNNTVSWTIGANGGKALTSHSISGSDGTSYTGISASATSYNATDNTPSASSPGSQTYTITAINDNGTSLGATTSSVTTVAPFFPFFPFFPPYFPFFPPFFPFFPSFKKTAFVIGGYIGYCLSEGVDVLTPSGTKPIESLKVGDTLLVPSNESVNFDEVTGEFNISDNVELVNDTIIDIEVNEKLVMYFNNDEKFAVSFNQPIFTIKDGKQIVTMSEDIVIGDHIVTVDENGKVNKKTIESINYLENTKQTYVIKLANSSFFIAEGVLVNQ